MKRKFSGIILAAGFGRRLMPLTKKLPKPLIDINGITLLDNSIDFLKKLGCENIVINTHYMSDKIIQHIDKRSDKELITILYEKEILDTGGGVINAIPYFKNQDIIITNSDIFWRHQNINDCLTSIKIYCNNTKPYLLLVKKDNIFGLNKSTGDFVLKNNIISRYKFGNKIFFYSGLQIINTRILGVFFKKKFSFNDIWDYLIDNNNLSGNIMKSNIYHVGDIQGLRIAKELDS